MKKMNKAKKRLMSYLLTVAMLISCVQGMGTFAKAEDEIPAIELGKTETVTIPEFGEAVFSFTPEEDGLYRFYSISGEDTIGWVLEGEEEIAYNDDGQFSDYPDFNFYVFFEGKAGTEYTLHATDISSNCITIDVRIELCAEPTSFEIADVGESLTFYEGDVYGREFEVSFEPSNAFAGEVTWESSNEEVISIDYNGYFIINSLGTSVITASAGDFTDSVTVNVVKPVEVSNDTAISVDMNYLEDRWVGTFTPESDGEYAFAVFGNYYYLHIYDEDGNQFVFLSESDDFDCEELTGGKTYTIEILNYSVDDNSVEFIVSDNFEAEKIEAENGKDEISVSMHYEHNLSYKYYPIYANDESVSWTVEDESVAKVEGTYLIGIAPGRTKVTLTTESGLTDSFYVTVREPIVWEGEKTETVLLSEIYPSQTYKFTVSKSGTYTIYSEGNYCPYLRIVDIEGNQIGLANEENDNNFEWGAYLQAEDIYYLVLNDESESSTASFRVTVYKNLEDSSEITGIEFSEDKMSVGVGDKFIPGYSFITTGINKESVRFESSDENILEVQSDGIKALAVGTATITIASKSGFTDTIEITVTVPPAIEIDTVEDVKLDENYEIKSYSFTAPSDGTYVFSSRGLDADPFVNLYDEEGNFTDGYDDNLGTNFCFEYDMSKDDVVYLILNHYGDSAEFEFSVAKKATPNMMDLYIPEGSYLKFENNTYYVPVGDYIPFVISFDNLGVLASDYYITTEGNISISSINSLKMEKPGNASITVSAYGFMKTLNIVAVNLNVGDVNYDNKIDVNDMIIIQQVADGNADVNETTLVLCDVNGDNKVDEKDVEEIAKNIGFETDETFTVSTEVFNKVSYQAYLIEPWAMRATVRFTDAEGTTIDVADMQDYGVYAIRAGMLDALEEGEVTIKDIILDSDTIYYGMSDTEGEGMWATGDGRATFSFDDGLFTYRLSEEIYWVAYCKDADGNAHFTTYKTKSLSAIANSLVAASTTNAYIKAILEDMLVMEEAIVDYRSDFDNLTDLEPSNPNTVGDCGIDFGPAATDGKYAIGNSYRVSLIEPWSVRLIARIYDTTDEDTSSTDHIDYSMADDYGVIVFQDIDGTHGNMTSYEDLLALDDAYVYSKSQGNMEIDPDDSNRVSAAYDQDIFTYQLDKNIYCVSFVEIDGQFYYSKVLTRNLLSYMEGQVEAGTASAKLLTVFEAMVEMYESVKAYHGTL